MCFLKGFLSVGGGGVVRCIARGDRARACLSAFVYDSARYVKRTPRTGSGNKMYAHTRREGEKNRVSGMCGLRRGGEDVGDETVFQKWSRLR